MAKKIYEAGDIQGYDFAFDAAGNIIDWSPVVEAAEERDVRLSLSLGMLFPQSGEVDHTARFSVKIEGGSTENEIRRSVYAGIRDYIRRVAARIYEEETGEAPDEGDPDYYAGVPGAVALVSSVSMR